MDSDYLRILAWFLFAIAIGGVNIYAACLLWRERGIAPRLMLSGAILAALGGIGANGMWLYQSVTSSDFLQTAFQVLSSLSGLGWFLLSLGWLLFALRRRALAARIAELEAIVEAGRERDGSR